MKSYSTTGRYLYSHIFCPPNGLPPHRGWEVFLGVGLRSTAGAHPPAGPPKPTNSPIFPRGKPS